MAQYTKLSNSISQPDERPRQILYIEHEVSPLYLQFFFEKSNQTISLKPRARILVRPTPRGRVATLLIPSRRVLISQPPAQPYLHQFIPHDRGRSLIPAKEQPDMMQPAFDQIELRRVRYCLDSSSRSTNEGGFPSGRRCRGQRPVRWRGRL